MKKIIDKNKFNKTNNKIKEKKERPKSSYVKRILNIKGPDFPLENIKFQQSDRTPRYSHRSNRTEVSY